MIEAPAAGLKILLWRSVICLLLLAVASCGETGGSQSSGQQAASAVPGQTPLQATPPEAATIEQINHYRAMLQIPASQFDPQLSAAADHHARYLVENHIAAVDGELANGALIENARAQEAHRESPDKPFYTADGARLADVAVVVGARSIPEPSKAAGYIDQLMTKPFDELSILNPRSCSSVSAATATRRPAGSWWWVTPR
jgi:hypothetical protein